MMTQWMRIVSTTALASAAALVASGCLAESPGNEHEDAVTADSTTVEATEPTGETQQAWGLGGPLFAAGIGARALPFLANPLLGGIGEFGFGACGGFPGWGGCEWNGGLGACGGCGGFW